MNKKKLRKVVRRQNLKLVKGYNIRKAEKYNNKTCDLVKVG